ncbi:MAG: helix-turn-helix domain-containing protein [Lachnospiraceae bacterium]|nr:helix-turn-helix domain-containing protein [Lachnospiraceae bacterium]
MQTIIPYSSLDPDSWAEDFTPSQNSRRRYMYIQCMGHYHARPSYGVLKRSNLHSYLFLYTISGCGVIDYLDEEVLLPAGKAAIINCEDVHSYYCVPSQNWDFCWIHFSGSCIDGYLSEIMESWGVVPIPGAEETFRMLFEKRKQEDLVSGIECSTMLISLCSSFLLALKQEQSNSEQKILPIVRSAIGTLEEKFTEDLSLDALCGELGISKYYLSHIFKEYTGFSPYEYLINVRLSFAKSLLRSTDQTISDISDRCGFSSSSHFIQTFRRREGITPRRYREYFLNLSAS